LSVNYGALNTDPSKLQESLRDTKKQKALGTPDYMAPELLEGEGLNDPVIDWWALGVMLFELMTGIPPFNDPNIEKVFENIRNRAIPWDEVNIGDEEGEISLDAQDLINKLLEPDPKKRLGANGAGEIKRHQFFSNLDFTS
jgi:serine/threonine protein kinase